MLSKLKSKNVTVNGRRTSMRLEEEMWSALDSIAKRKKTSVNHICSRAEQYQGAASLTSAVRVFVLLYFRRMSRIGDLGTEVVAKIDYVFGRK